MAAKRHVIAFDMIGTVFSLESMRPRLVSVGLPESALDSWFAAGLRDAFALAATDRFAPFSSVLENALADIIARQGIEPEGDKVGDVLDGLKTLDAHPDAAEAFRILKAAGLRVLALSNGAAAASEGLLKRAGLSEFVERVAAGGLPARLGCPRREKRRSRWRLYLERTASCELHLLDRDGSEHDAPGRLHGPRAHRRSTHSRGDELKAITSARPCGRAPLPRRRSSRSRANTR